VVKQIICFVIDLVLGSLGIVSVVFIFIKCPKGGEQNRQYDKRGSTHPDISSALMNSNYPATRAQGKALSHDAEPARRCLFAAMIEISAELRAIQSWECVRRPAAR
jgi:hypothetical protein